METLIQYLETAETLDNGQLLAHYERLSHNKILVQSMRRSTSTRDTFIRYEVWKILPEEVQSQYQQDLSKVVQAQEEKEKELEEIEQSTTKVKQGNGESELVQEKARLYNERAKLANSLHEFDGGDNTGRKLVIDQITELDEKIGELNLKLQGKGVPPPAHKPSEYEWLKSSEEKAAMSDAEIRVYKTALTNRRGKASSAIKKGEKIPENQVIINIIDNERLTLE